MKSNNVKLSIYIILIWAILSFVSLSFAFPEEKSFMRGGFNIWIGVYILFIGIIFILSYFYPQKTFIFRWIAWFFERPFGVRWALFLGIVAVVVGMISILSGLGIVWN